MRCFIERGLAILAALLAAAGCMKVHAPARAKAGLTLYWTCDAHGRLEPCGCFSGQHGGLTRISTLLKSGDLEPGLLADSGSALAGTADYQLIQYRYMQQAFADMGYTALNMGESEAQLSAAQLRQLRDTAPARSLMISANLIDNATGQPIFAPYRIVPWQGYRVAFVGAVADVPEDSLGAGVAIEPAKSALGKLLPEIKKQADVIVLLAYADEAAMRALADEFYEIDVILGGKVKEPSQSLTRQNRSVVLWTTNETKALGMLATEIGGPKGVAARDFNIYFIQETIAQDPQLTQLAQNYREEIRSTKLAVDDPARVRDDEVPGVKSAAVYVGSESCAQCHAVAYKTWQATGHARAFQSLVARGSDADPNCIGCHTIGFGEPSGYRRDYGATKLVNVGCETCHGPGSEHVSDIRRTAPVVATGLYRYRPLGPADCAGCHRGEFSRPFKYDEFWPKIEHGSEPPSEPPPQQQANASSLWKHAPFSP